MADLVFAPGGATTNITVQTDVLSRVGELLKHSVAGIHGAAVSLVTDDRVRGLYGRTVADSLAAADLTVHEFSVPPGEASKSLAVAERVYAFLAERAVGRDGLMLALGGGVVSDLAGFVAATWMRGIPFAVCPTTLESAIDASLGGKTAVNIAGGKNLVGVFHQPRLVAIDPRCLTTLEPRDVRAGLAESVKHALLVSEPFLAWHEACAGAILALESDVVSELILRNLQIKGAIVEEDTLERTGRRMLLNFGHTIGHAIESCCAYRLRHGECVALGIVAACRLSRRLGLLDDAVVSRVEALLARLGLPTRLTEPPAAEAVLDTIARDKKAKGGRVRFVLLAGVGVPVVRDDVTDAQIRDAYASLF